MRKISFFIFVFVVIWPVYAQKHKTVALVSEEGFEQFRMMVSGFKQETVDSKYSFTIVEYNVKNFSNDSQKIRANPPDLIVTFGSKSTLAVLGEDFKLPIIYSGVLKPQQVGILGRVVTGVSFDIPFSQHVEALLKLNPKLSRIGVIYNPADNSAIAKEVKLAVEKEKIAFHGIEVRNLADIAKLNKLDVDGLIFIADVLVCQNIAIRQILKFCLNENIIVLGLSPSYTRAGAAMSLVIDYFDIGKQTAELANNYFIQPLVEPDVFYPRKIGYSLNKLIIKRLRLNVAEAMYDDAVEVFGQ